jgi:uncharacterized RDD family membrane protein YckC
MPSALDAFFPPEKDRLDAPPPGPPRHEFEVEDRRHTDWPRRKAIVIDSFVLGACFFLIHGAIHGYLGAGVFTTALALTYFFVMEATTGQTIGKKMMGLRVVMRDGRPAPANAVAARTVFRLIDVMPFAWVLGGLTMLLTGGRRQRFGDLAARTVVRRDDRPMPKAPHSPLLGLYPVLWIGVSLAVMWQAALWTPSVDVHGELSADPGLQRINEICERRIVSEIQNGAFETETEAATLWMQSMGAIDSLPVPDGKKGAKMRKTKRLIRRFLYDIGEARSEFADTLDERRLGALGAKLDKRFRKMQKRFRKLGLPHCAAGSNGVG